jgi:hypothetical protein
VSLEENIGSQHLCYRNHGARHAVQVNAPVSPNATCVIPPTYKGNGGQTVLSYGGKTYPPPNSRTIMGGYS